MQMKLVLGSRILMGLIFLVFGLNGLMFIFTGGGFIPMPPPSEEMMKVMGGFFAAVYLMPLVKVIEVVGGALLLWGKYRNLALVLLTPVVVNIFLIHAFVDLEGMPMSVALAFFTIVLIKDRWADFKVFLKA